MDERMKEEEWATIKETAKAAGYNEHYLRLLCREGKVEAEKIGGLIWMVNVPDVIDYKVHRARGGDGDE